MTWVHSYVNADKTKTFCVYDGPDPEAIRRAAGDNNLPLERITQVNVLAPYVITAIMGRDTRRLVYLSSGLHREGSASLDDLQWQRRRWWQWCRR